MRYEIVREVFLKELRETLRDRRSVAVMFGIPMLLYPLMTMGMAGLGASTQRRMAEQVIQVAVIHPDAVPHLVAQMRKAGSGVRRVILADPRAALAEGQIDAVIVAPARAEADALAERDVSIRVRLDRSRSGAAFTQRKLDRLLDDYERWIVEQRLSRRGMPASLVRPLKTVTEDVATSGRRLGSVLALMLPVMLLVTGMLGAFFPAVNATTAERELGTLETLLVAPVSKMELLVAKGGLVLLSGLLTAGINMLSMSLVLWRSFAAVARGSQSVSLEPGTLALTYLAAVPGILFAAAGVLVVGLFARNYREANAYATPVMMLSMAPMVISITEPKPTPGLLATPIVNTSLIMRDVLTGHASASAFLLAFFSSCLYAGLMLSVAARLFTTENLVNPAWEPLSLKGLRRGSGKRARRLPAPDEALALFAVSLLLLLYIGPLWVKQGLMTLLAGTEILLVAAPALLAAWLGRYAFVETFSWRRPTVSAMVGAALIGVGVLPWVYALSFAQERVWPRDPEYVRAATELFLPALTQHPFLTAVAVGALAGVCEELLYRGPLQAGLLRRLPVGLALGLGAVLFAAAHLDVQGILFRALLGLLLGWIVLRGGSIFPAMLMHGVIDSASFGFQAWLLHGWGAKRYLEWATHPEKALADPGFVRLILAMLAVGSVLAVVGWRLFGLSHGGHRGRGGERFGGEEPLG